MAGSFEHGQSLWWRDSEQFAEVVKQPNGKAGRYPGQKMLKDNNEQGMGWCAIITNDMPPNVLTPTYARVGQGNFVGAGFGTNDMYKYLDGTKLKVKHSGPDRHFEGFTTATMDGKQTQGAGGAQGTNTMVPPMANKGK